MGKINSKQIEIDGHVFDSKTEAEFYETLKNDTSVKHIELQPQFILLDGFEANCRNCVGTGKVSSVKTGRQIQCKRCEGSGVKHRQPWTYKADFKVTYQDGTQEVIDVKGYANERFPLVKKMWEYRNRQELIVVKKQKGKWVRK